MIHAVLYLSLHLSAKEKRKVIKEIRHRLEKTAEYLGDYSHHPPVFTTDKADSLYVLRATEDIEIVRLALRFYERGQVEIDVVQRAAEQMDRDIEDIPPSLADKPVPHAKKI